MKMIEKMARAMTEADSGPEGSALFDIHWEEFGEGYKESARIALMAVRSPPTETLLLAIKGRKLNNGDFLRALVDAAIEEDR